jgi:hypothetical protein
MLYVKSRKGLNGRKGKKNISLPSEKTLGKLASLPSVRKKH